MVRKSEMKYLDYAEYKKFFLDCSEIDEYVCYDGIQTFELLKMKGTLLTYIMTRENGSVVIVGIAGNIEEAREWCKNHHRKPIVKF